MHALVREVSSVVQRLPKIDLHAHLTGSLRESSVAEMAGISSAASYLRLSDNTVSYSDFFRPWNTVLAWIPESPENVRRMILEVAEDFARDNVRYSELRVSARKALQEREYGAWVSAICSACEEAEDRHGISLGIVLGFARQRFSSEASAGLAQELVELISARNEPRVVGMDLWGDESQPSTLDTNPWLQQAKGAGIPLSLHVGEVYRADTSVLRSILQFAPQRISHGPAIRNSPRMLSILRKRGILTEVCLTSNLRTMTNQPFRSKSMRDLISSGAPFAFCTDDAGIFQTSMTNEITAALEYDLVSVEQLAQSIRWSVKHSFAPASLKSKLLEELETRSVRSTFEELGEAVENLHLAQRDLLSKS
jgi:adenosine deaminase